MGIRKVSGGKRIDRWMQAVDGRHVPIDVYMARVTQRYASFAGGTPIDLVAGESSEDRYPVGAPCFHALCEEADVHLVSLDLAKLEKAVRALVEQRIQVAWRPMLVVTVDGDRAPLFVSAARRRHREDAPGPRTLLEGDEAVTDFKMEIKVEAVSISEILGKKYHRTTQPNDGYVRRPTRVIEGWPEVGDFTKPDDRHDSRWHHAKTIAMVDDTPENRAALLAIRMAFERATSALDRLLHPDNVAATLRQALEAQPSVLALPSGERKGRAP